MLTCTGQSSLLKIQRSNRVVLLKSGVFKVQRSLLSETRGSASPFEQRQKCQPPNSLPPFLSSSSRCYLPPPPTSSSSPHICVFSPLLFLSNSLPHVFSFPHFLFFFSKTLPTLLHTSLLLSVVSFHTILHSFCTKMR